MELCRVLDLCSKLFDKFLLLGDFNAQEGEGDVEDFLYIHDLKNIQENKTCYKSVNNPSCIDLILTNSSRSFQNMHNLYWSIRCTQNVFDCNENEMRKI